MNIKKRYIGKERCVLTEKVIKPTYQIDAIDLWYDKNDNMIKAEIKHPFAATYYEKVIKTYRGYNPKCTELILPELAPTAMEELIKNLAIDKLRRQLG